MLLDALVSVIDTVQKRIKAHRPSLQQNETRTRMALIDPLLTALGWDVSDPSLVMPEYRVGKSRADYALKGPKNRPVAIVEAKHLGHVLDDDEWIQMVNYANMEGVDYAAVTDGDVWELYEVFRRAPLADRRLLNLKITDKPAHELALQLLLLWQPNLASGKPVAAQEPVLGSKTRSKITDREAFCQSVNTPSVPTSPVPQPPPAQPLPVDSAWIWQELSRFTPKREKRPNGGRAPKAKCSQKIRFENGEEKSLKFWYDLLIVTGEWLHKMGQLSQYPKSSVLTTDHSNLLKPIEIPETGFYVDINRGADYILKDMKTLLNDYNISLDTIWILVPDETP